MTNSIDTLLRQLAADTRLTVGLGDVESRMLIDWLTDWAEVLFQGPSARRYQQEILVQLCHRARAIRQFVWLWSYEQAFAAASQLAASTRFLWPLPTEPLDPVDLMQHIIAWESSLHQSPFSSAPIPGLVYSSEG